MPRITKVQLKSFQALTMKHRELATKFHTEVGQLWSIPDCCIQQFAIESAFGIPSAIHRLSKFNMPHEILNGIDYVPCDNCMAKIIKDRIPY